MTDLKTGNDILYFEDLQVGQTLKSDTYKVTKEEVIAYANKYDPQPMHTDPEWAENEGPFGTLIASGWLTASMTMRLFVGLAPKITNGLLGRMINKMEWPRPTYPGDEIYVTCTIEDMRPSGSKPHLGIVRTTNITYNQNDEEVQRAEIVMMLTRRPSE